MDPTGVNWGPIAGMKSTYFDGSDYFTIPSHADLNFGTGFYTIEFWINTHQSETWNYFNAQLDTGIRLAIGVNGSYSSSGGQISLNEQSGNSDSHVTSRVRIDDGKWHHVAFCRDNLTRRCFVDGKLEYRDTTVSRNMDNSNVNFIGRRSNGAVNLKVIYLILE